MSKIEERTIHMFAEAGDVVESNPVYMTVVFKAFDTRTDKNNQRLSEEFLQGVIEKSDFYAGTPIKVDSDMLTQEAYTKLTHLYDENEKEFGAEQIGSIQKFELKEDDSGEKSMYCTARIEKAKHKVADGIEQLFKEGDLTFSYEIQAGDLEYDGDVVVVTGSEKNYLTAMCVVSVPACEDASAEILIAEAVKEETEMNDGKAFGEQAEQMFAQMQAPAFARALGRAAMETGEISYDWMPLAEYADSVVFIHFGSGRMKQIYGREEGNQVILDRTEDVEFAPVAQAADQNGAVAAEDDPKEPVNPQNQEKETEQPPEEDGSSRQPTEENRALSGEEDEIREPEDAPDSGDNQPVDMDELEKLRSEVERLRRKCAEYEQMNAEHLKAEADAERTRIRAYASEIGVTEDEAFKEAVENLDYKGITQKLMASHQKVMNPFLTDGIQMGKTGTWRDYLHE